MRDPKRIDKVLNLLERYWKANPDLRLSQIMGNAGFHYNSEDGAVMDYLADQIVKERP